MDNQNILDQIFPLRNGITLIEASAGTGKTYTIGEIFLKLLLSDNNEFSIHNILVVTFTEAATQELKDRLRRKLLEINKENLSETLRGKLMVALSNFDQANIFTIHGFSRKILLMYAFESGMEFDLEVEPNMDLLSDIVDEIYIQEMEKLDDLMRKACLKENILNDLKMLLPKIVEDPSTTMWPTPNAPQNQRFDINEWMQSIAEAARQWNMPNTRKTVMDILNDAISNGCLNKRSYTAEKIEQIINHLTLYLASGQHPLDDEIEMYLRPLSASHLKSKTNKGKSPPSHSFFNICDEICKQAEMFAKTYFYEWKLSFFHSITKKIIKEYTQAKKQRKVMTFDDLLLYLRDALFDQQKGATLKKAIRDRYKIALVDEFQDTDPIQWAIFKEIFNCEGHHLVLVGDPKQSIYAFRKADIYTYLDARKNTNKPLCLYTNFRSDRNLVEAINRLYEMQNPFGMPEIGYIKLMFGQMNEDWKVSNAKGFEPLTFIVLEAEDNRSLKSDMLELIPSIVSEKIVSLLNSGVQVDQKWIEPKDIAVLVRTNNQARMVRDALKKRHVPAVIYGLESVFQSKTATDLALVMNAILNPRDRKAVKTALATSIISIRPEDILLMEMDNPPIFDKWVETFANLRDQWFDNGFIKMCGTLFQNHVLENMCKRPDSDRVLTDFRHCMEILANKEHSNSLSPEALYEWFIEQTLLSSPHPEEWQERLEKDEDAVEIVTIHKAKGLEYPIVFCPYLWESGLSSERIYRLHTNKDCTKVILNISKLLVQRNAQKTISNQELERFKEEIINLESSFEKVLEVQSYLEVLRKIELFYEELRKVYVALTRAKHMCVVFVPTIKDVNTSALGWLLWNREGKFTPLDWISRKQDHLEPFDQIKEEGRICIQREGCEVSITPYHKSTETENLAAKEFTRAYLNDNWSIASFSTIASDIAMTDDEMVAQYQGEEDEDCLLKNFPVGMNPGLCIHKIFERMDKEDVYTEHIITETLQEYGLDVCYKETVLEMIKRVQQYPLKGDGLGFSLNMVDKKTRFTEMDFLFPVPIHENDGIIKKMVSVLETYGTEVSKRYVNRLRQIENRKMFGFMTGKIDLVFRYNEAWYILDYKTNRLGPNSDSYRYDHLLDEMVRCDYVLQYHIYSVALYKYLRGRLKSYDHSKNFGGVFYLFLRGMKSDDTGVFFDRLNFETLDGLSKLFE